MGSYVQARKDVRLIGGHICSKCKSTIITEFAFYAIANSRWTEKKAKAGAEAAMELGKKALLSFPEKPFAVAEIIENRSYSLISGFGTNLLTHACPYCGHREDWQLQPSASMARDPETGVSLVSNVPVESRLTVLASAEMLDEWRKNVATPHNIRIKGYWDANPEKAEELRGQLRKMQEELEALKAGKAAAYEKSNLLKQKIESKEAEMKGYSMFSADRKTAKAELKELNKQYDAQYAADVGQDKNAAYAIETTEKNRKMLLIENPGILGEIETVTPADAPYCTATRMC